MASAVKRTATEREESCFSRAARAIRRALSRICGDPPDDEPTTRGGPHRPNALGGSYSRLCQSSPPSVSRFEPLSAPPSKPPHIPQEPSSKSLGGEETYGKGSSVEVYESLGERKTCGKGSSVEVYESLGERKTYLKGSSVEVYKSLGERKTCGKGSSEGIYLGLEDGGGEKFFICSSSSGSPTDPFDDRWTGSIENTCRSLVLAPPGDNQDVTIEMEMNEAGRPTGSKVSSQSRSVRASHESGLITAGPLFHILKRKGREDDGPRCKSVRKPSCSQSITPTVAEPPCARGRPAVTRDLTGFAEGGVAQHAFEFSSAGSESEPGGGGDVGMEMDAPVAAVKYTVTNALPERGRLPPPWSSGTDSSRRSRSRSLPSLSGMTSVENEALRRAQSSPDMLRSGFEDFTPDIAEDEIDESYRFRCSCPGLYRCGVTGLLFHMAGEGVVVYRTVPWDRRLLARHHKKPAGPLFEIQCEQRSVRGLHLQHCEIRSTGGADFLSVAHVKDEGVEFIDPREVTETHVVVNITGFSAFGNVKDENSPPVPVQALVLLFYRSPVDLDPESLLNVLLLPKNVVLRDVLRTRKKLVGDESYIETSPHCKLTPEQEYTLSTRPGDDQVLVQPTEAEFDCDDYGNYFPSFQVTWETTLNHIKLLLRDANGSHGVWERRVCLSSARVRRLCGPSALDLPPPERLLDIRSRFVEGISGPVLKSLLDKLLEKTVMTDAERESADVMPNVRDKARFVIDAVRKKGEAAASEMIEILSEADPFLCEHLGLI